LLGTAARWKQRDHLAMRLGPESPVPPTRLFPVGDMQGYLNFMAYGEFAAENRAAGWNTWVTFSISPPAPGAPPTTKPIVRKY
jgi:hypothetical protein